MDYLEIIHSAIDYIEEHLTDEISLQDISGEAGLSPYHFHRIFHGITGNTVSEYIRERRLSLASDDLVSSKKRIIEISVEYGFESQESFTRAFKKQFGLTPAKYRTNQKHSMLFKKKRLTETGLKHLNGGITMEPKIITKESFKVVGMEGKTTLKNNKIPGLWHKFMRVIGEIKNRINNNVAYGICECVSEFDAKNFNEDTEFTELVCVEVSKFDNIPEGMVGRTLQTQKYAVFTHRGPLTNLRSTYDYIYGTWLKNSGYEIAEADDFEYYDERFNPVSQEDSEFDIYIPVK